MKPDRSHNDRIVLAAVGVLAMLLLGMIVLAFADKALGEEAYVVAGAIVGLIGGYVTAGRSHNPVEVTDVESSVDVVESTGTVPLPAGDEAASDPALVAQPVGEEPVSADEALGGVGHAAYTEVTEEELNNA